MKALREDSQREVEALRSAVKASEGLIQSQEDKYQGLKAESQQTLQELRITVERDQHDLETASLRFEEVEQTLKREIRLLQNKNEQLREEGERKDQSLSLLRFQVQGLLSKLSQMERDQSQERLTLKQETASLQR